MESPPRENAGGFIYQAKACAASRLYVKIKTCHLHITPKTHSRILLSAASSVLPFSILYITYLILSLTFQRPLLLIFYFGLSDLIFI